MVSNAPRNPGRPRRQEPLSPADRMSLWRQQLRAAGGREVRTYLGATAARALKQMAPGGRRGPFIEDLILQEWRRRGMR